MKQLLLLFVVLLVTFQLFSCKKKGGEVAPLADSTLLAGDSLDAVPDSTLYGVADDFGMSSFSLISDAGDTLLMTRISEDGTDSKIYGDAQPGQRYAITTRDHDEALATAYNLTQLERFITNYRLVNGQLYLSADSMPYPTRILELDDKHVKFIDREGKEQTVD